MISLEVRFSALGVPQNEPKPIAATCECRRLVSDQRRKRR